MASKKIRLGFDQFADLHRFLKNNFDLLYSLNSGWFITDDGFIVKISETKDSLFIEITIPEDDC